MSSTFGLVFLLPDFSIIQIVASSTTHPDLIRVAISADRNAVPRDVSLTLRRVQDVVLHLLLQRAT